ncbi:MAG: 2OG-Fe(II) oxygenase [Gammaproteobacteria bacterium]|nr:2OG-Fe(II) oxygenase [Gammaproteobacteria bacterium]
MKDHLTHLIVQRLTDAKDQLSSAFNTKHPIKVARHFVLDDLLPTEIAENIYANFPKPNKMHLIKCRGIKFKYSHLKDTAPLLQDINAAIQDPRVVNIIEEITGIQHQIPDPTKFAGGISTLLKGYYINPHLDNSHDVVMKRYYRTVNVLYYVSPDWSLENGGNYELWDESISERILVPSLFNRLLVMETNSYSWHAVNPVLCNARRCCVFNYYFSEHSPEHRDYFFSHSSFKARPEQTYRRAIESVKKRLWENILRVTNP